MEGDEEDIAAKKAKEDADKKAAEEAAFKSKQEKEAADKLKADEEAKKKAQQPTVANLTEEQWQVLEKQYDSPRKQILMAWSIAQAAHLNSPALKVVEKDAWEEATKDVADINFFKEDAKKAVEAMSPQDRQDPKKVRKEVMAVRGEKVRMSSDGGGARRFSSGLDSGGSSSDGGVKDEDLPADIRDLSPEGRKQEIEKRLNARRELRAQIVSLAKQRDEFIATERKKTGKQQTGFDAAVAARYFDTKSKKLGDEFRDAVFADQPNIHTQDDLRNFAQKFATNRKQVFPFVVDPQGKLAAEVKADYALGQSVGLQHTPTIWVVTNKTNGSPFVEVVDRSKLFELIDQALAETKPAGAVAHGAKGK